MRDAGKHIDTVSTKFTCTRPVATGAKSTPVPCLSSQTLNRCCSDFLWVRELTVRVKVVEVGEKRGFFGREEAHPS